VTFTKFLTVRFSKSSIAHPEKQLDMAAKRMPASDL
jgi:hypothetical protein